MVQCTLGNINYEVVVQTLDDVNPNDAEGRWDAAFLFSFDAGNNDCG